MNKSNKVAAFQAAEAYDPVDAQLFPFVDPMRWQSSEPLVIERGEGVYVFDTKGNRYIEAMSGLWCVGLGFSDRKLIDAAARQLESLPYYHNFMGKAAEPSLRLAHRLTQLAPEGMDHVFFASSGSEAIDTAAKLIWYYQNAVGRPGKKRLIARWDAYHGSGVLSGGLTGMSSLHKGFDLPLSLVLRTGSPHYLRERHEGESEREFSARRASELEELILREGPETIGGFFGEPMIGSGGVIIPPQGYWEAIQLVLERYEILLVADEIITGFGRTGSMFGVETFGLRPAMMTLAKQLTSGYQPMSAVLLRSDIHDAIAAAAHQHGTFGHGFTYGGHPVACAVALAALDRYEELDIARRVTTLGTRLKERLRSLHNHPSVMDVRSIGLIGAVEFAPDDESAARAQASPGSFAAPVVEEAERRGVIFRPLGDVLGICPPMIVSEDELDTVCTVLIDSIHAVYGVAAFRCTGSPCATIATER